MDKIFFSPSKFSLSPLKNKDKLASAQLLRLGGDFIPSHVTLSALYTLGAYISCSSPEIVNCSSSREEGREEVGREDPVHPATLFCWLATPSLLFRTASLASSGSGGGGSV